MAHYVNCTICGERFNRDKIAAELVGTKRYAHKTCLLQKIGSPEEKAKAEQEAAEQKKQADDLAALEDYINKLFNTDFVNPTIRKQINDYHDKYKYTYSGILKSLIYFFDINHHSTENCNGGIGIVPYVYDQAKEYYTRLWKIQQVNNDKPIEQFVTQEQEIIKIDPPQPHKRKQNKLFSFLDEEEENGI